MESSSDSETDSESDSGSDSSSDVDADDPYGAACVNLQTEVKY